MSKENVISEKAIENAEKIFKSIQKQYLINDTLPKAWEKILTEPDGLLVELLADTTERLCGYKPDNETVEQFLTKICYKPPQPKIEILTPGQPYNRVAPLPSEGYRWKSIASFTFKGNKYPVRSWKEMLIKICNLMLSAHKEQFDKVLNLAGRKRPYFTRNPNELRKPERINNTEIYVETHLSANSIVKLAKNILAVFGYGEDDWFIEVR